MRQVVFAALAAILAFASFAEAQIQRGGTTPASIVVGPDTITSNGDAVTLTGTKGMGSAKVQVTGTYDTTWEAQCAVAVSAGSPVWDSSGDPLGMVRAGTTTEVTSVSSDPVAIYSINNIAGCVAIRVIATAYTSGTQSVTIVAVAAGGGGGSGGGGGTFDGVLKDAAGGDSVTDTANDAIRVNVVAGAGSGGTAIADDAAFTPGTTNVTPAGGTFDDVAPDSVNEGDAGAVRMSANRNLYTTIRDAAGNERGLNIDASGRLTAVVTATDLDVQSGGADILSTTAFNSAFGTAGTADSQVISVQGIASMTPILATVSGTNIDVQIGGSDILSVQSNSLNLVPGLAEDGVHVSGEAGALIFGVRQDSQSNFGADGDRVPFSINNAGELRVAFSGAAGGTSLADDGDITAGTTAGTPAMGFYQSSVTACTDGDSCIVGITAQRTLKATLFSAAGAELTVATDWTVGSAIGTTGPGVQAVYSDFDGSALPTITNVNTEGEAVPIAASIKGVQYSMQVNEDGSVAAWVQHDAADSGLLVGAGARATTSVSGQTEVANADRAALVSGIDGVLIVRPHSNLEDRVSAVVSVTDGSSTSLVASQGAGMKFCATTIIVSNSSATNVTVDLRDGTGGSVLATIPAAANMGGAVIPLQTPLCTSDATALAMDPSAAASTVTVTAIGFKSDL